MILPNERLEGTVTEIIIRKDSIRIEIQPDTNPVPAWVQFEKTAYLRFLRRLGDAGLSHVEDLAGSRVTAVGGMVSYTIDQFWVGVTRIL